MADAGGGNMYYIEQPDQAAAIFNDELQGLLDLGAQNVAVVVTPAGASTLTAVHHHYPSARTGSELRVELGDIYTREPKPLLAEFLVSDADTVDETLVATLTLSADVLTDGGVEHQIMTIPVKVAAGEAARVEPELRRELLLLDAAKARREALELRERGDHDGATDVLRNARQKLQEAGMDDAELREEADELGTVAASFAAREVSLADQKYMYQRAYNSSTGRRMKDELIRRRRRDEEPPSA